MNEIQRAKLLQEEYDARLNTRGGDHKSEQFMNQKVENRLIDSGKTAEKNPVRHAVAVEHNLNPSAVRLLPCFIHLPYHVGFLLVGEVPSAKLFAVHPLKRSPLFRVYVQHYVNQYCI